MNRMIVAIPTGLVAGALVGLMIGGLWLHWQLGTDMNAGQSRSAYRATARSSFVSSISAPTRRMIIRLIGAVLFEQNDGWQSQHRYMQVEAFALIDAAEIDPLLGISTQTA